MAVEKARANGKAKPNKGRALAPGFSRSAGVLTFVIAATHNDDDAVVVHVVDGFVFYFLLTCCSSSSNNNQWTGATMATTITCARNLQIICGVHYGQSPCHLPRTFRTVAPAKSCCLLWKTCENVESGTMEVNFRDWGGLEYLRGNGLLPRKTALHFWLVNGSFVMEMAS